MKKKVAICLAVLLLLVIFGGIVAFKFVNRTDITNNYGADYLLVYVKYDYSDVNGMTPDVIPHKVFIDKQGRYTYYCSEKYGQLNSEQMEQLTECIEGIKVEAKLIDPKKSERIMIDGKDYAVTEAIIKVMYELDILPIKY